MSVRMLSSFDVRSDVVDVLGGCRLVRSVDEEVLYCGIMEDLRTLNFLMELFVHFCRNNAVDFEDAVKAYSLCNRFRKCVCE